VIAGDVLGDGADEAFLDGGAQDVDVGEVVLLGKGVGELGGRDETERNERLSEADADGGVQGERLGQLPGSEAP